MNYVKPKKGLGQHFLKNEEICERIANAITLHGGYNQALEIGPGMGALTKYLLARDAFVTHVVEIDRESVDYLQVHMGALRGRIHERDFLHMPLDQMFRDQFETLQWLFQFPQSFPKTLHAVVLGC